MDSLLRLYKEEVTDQLDEVHALEVGKEQYKVAIDGITKLSGIVVELEKLKIEKQKIEYAHEETMRAHEIEREKQESERKSKQNEQIVNVGKFVASGVLIYSFASASFKFEEQGVMTSSVLKKTGDFIWKMWKL